MKQLEASAVSYFKIHDSYMLIFIATRLEGLTESHRETDTSDDAGVEIGVELGPSQVVLPS
jgi:hypothetical protein